MEDLPVLLNQATLVLESARNNPDLLFKEGEKGDKILVRIPSGDPGNLSGRTIMKSPILPERKSNTILPGIKAALRQYQN